MRGRATGEPEGLQAGNIPQQLHSTKKAKKYLLYIEEQSFGSEEREIVFPYHSSTRCALSAADLPKKTGEKTQPMRMVFSDKPCWGTKISRSASEMFCGGNPIYAGGRLSCSLSALSEARVLYVAPRSTKI